MKYSLGFLLGSLLVTPVAANAQDGFEYGNPQIQEVQAEAPAEEVPTQGFPVGQPLDPIPVDDAYSPNAQMQREAAPNYPQEQMPQAFQSLTEETAPAIEENPPVATPEPEPLAPELIDTQKAQLQILDKIDARVEDVEVELDKEKSYHELKIEVKRCVRSPQESKEENMVFMRIWDVGQGDYTNIVFSGWMLSSNPALHSFEHPIYDIVLLKCLDGSDKKKESAKEDKKADKKTAN